MSPAMRFLILAVALAAFVPVARCDEAGQGIPWLPVSDDFVWPKNPGPEVVYRKTRLDTLPPEVKALYDRNYLSNVGPKPFPESEEVAEVDLDGDGKTAYFVGIRTASGTGGTVAIVVARDATGIWRNIGTVQGQIFLHSEPKHRPALEIVGHLSSTMTPRKLMRFDGKQYRTVRYEIHDFKTGKVTVEKIPKDDPGGTPAKRREASAGK